MNIVNARESKHSRKTLFFYLIFLAAAIFICCSVLIVYLDNTIKASMATAMIFQHKKNAFFWTARNEN